MAVEYTDMTSSAVGSCPLGYADDDVDAAVIAAVKDGSIATLNCAEEVELAELLCRLHPWAEMCRFARTGGEAMAIAVRLARARTQRSVVAVCGYHGWSDWYLAANRAQPDALGEEGLLLPGLDPRGVPGAHGHDRHVQTQRFDGLTGVVREHQASSRRSSASRSVASGRQPGFSRLHASSPTRSRRRARLRRGQLSSAPERRRRASPLRSQPDLAVFAKGIGNGFPIGAVIGTTEIMEAAQQHLHQQHLLDRAHRPGCGARDAA